MGWPSWTVHYSNGRGITQTIFCHALPFSALRPGNTASAATTYFQLTKALTDTHTHTHKRARAAAATKLPISPSVSEGVWVRHTGLAGTLWDLLYKNNPVQRKREHLTGLKEYSSVFQSNLYPLYVYNYHSQEFEHLSLYWEKSGRSQ